MRIKQKLLTGFLLISLLTLGVSYGTGLLVQEETVDAFQLVGEKMLPGNIALARMTAELYHTLVLLAEFEENPTSQIQSEIGESLSNLDAHRTMHILYHHGETDHTLSIELEKLTQEFSRSVAQHLLLQQKGASRQQLRETRLKIDNLLHQFVESVNPHIEHEFASSHQQIAAIKQKNSRARKILLVVGIAILAFAFLLSFFIAHLISKPLLNLRNAAQEIGSGRLDLVLPVTSNDEVSDLARAFNEMAGNLSVMHTELVTANTYINNIVNSMVDALIVVSPAGSIQTVNGATCFLLDYKEEELVGKPLTTFFDSQLLPTEDLEEMADRDAIRDLNVEFKTRGGETIPMSISGSAMHDQSGKALAIILVARDVRELTRLVTELNNSNAKLTAEITERTQAEKALAAEKESLAVTLRSIGDGVITSDTAGKVVLVNKVAEALTGWTQAEAAGKPFAEVFQIINEKTRQTCENPVEKVLATGQVVGLANHTVLIAKDGTERNIADSGAPIHDWNSETIGVVLVFRDVTAEERVEKELLKIKKLESIGVLAGGIAHDFNNILAAILGNIDLALNFIKPEDKAYKLLDGAEKATLRAKDLTQQLLTFSKGGEPIKKLAAITEIISESSQFVLRGSNVRCEYQFAEDLWPVEIDAGQISQVIQNIVINADHAMPEGGIISIRCENSPLQEVVWLAPELTSPCIKITIKDQGIGIQPEHLEKIFDPYFSTKSKGSGLGMAITHSIISKHLGHIAVTSTVGEGTTFIILLPAAENSSSKEIPTIPTSSISNGKPLRVLLMDDEEMLLNMSCNMLDSMGHQCITAQNGADAIELYRQALEQGKPFDLTLMDLTIPGGMGGKEAVKEILALDKEAKLIASSGYSNDPVMANPAKYGFVGAIAKPYRRQEFIAAIEAAMAHNSG